MSMKIRKLHWIEQAKCETLHSVIVAERPEPISGGYTIIEYLDRSVAWTAFPTGTYRKALSIEDAKKKAQEHFEMMVSPSLEQVDCHARRLAEAYRMVQEAIEDRDCDDHHHTELAEAYRDYVYAEREGSRV